MSEAIEGSCSCGRVRYRVEEEDPPVYACHCTDCQSRTGGAVGLQMPVWANRLSVTGDLTQGRWTLPSGAKITVHSCPDCMTQIYAESSARPTLAVVRAGSRDDSASIVPVAHMWTRSKQPWVEIPDGARQYETQPEDQSDWIEILEFARRAP